MREFLTKTFSSKPITVCGVLFILIASTRVANAEPLHEARVSQVIQDVRLLEAHAAPHAASVNDKVTMGTAVRTGVESRAELTFQDLTITRLGANTIFTLNQAARALNLSNGTVLLQVPSGAPAVKANTTSVTVSVVGGTALVAAGPPTKFMVLEGTGTIYPLGHPEKAATVHGGEMVIAEGGHVNKPEQFDVKLVLATSPLLVDFPPLANLPLIQTVVDQQVAEQSVLIATSNQQLAKNMIETINVTDQSANSNPVVVVVRTGTPTPSITPPPTPTPSTTPPPTPTPSKYGTPATITSPNPYLITSGTTITTDPSITTNGVTDFGKIYRGSTDDGPFTLWAFGSTSAFDTALNIDTEFFAGPNHLPIAALKFQSLSLNGNPTIDTSNGGVTKLALIGVDGITSGPPGGTLTFTGLDLLVLATVNGSIDLTSDVSFQNLNELAMYARGAGSNLILSSPLSNIGIVELAAEGSILLSNPGTMSVGAFDATAGENLSLDIGGSLMLNGRVRLETLVLPGTTISDGANLALSIRKDFTNASMTDLLRARVTNFQGQIGAGGNILVGTGGNFTTNSDAEFLIQNTAGTINNGGNIVFATGGSISTGGEFSLLIENYDETANPAGHIGTGGNLSLITGGNLTANFASIAVNNRGGGRIDSGVSLLIDIAGALTTLHDGPDFIGNTASLSLAISTRYDDTAGNVAQPFIGGDASLDFHADSASIGGNLSVFVSDRGGSIGGNALLNFNVTHDVTVTGADIPNISTAADIELLNGSGTNVLSPFGGTIHGNATLQVSAANFSLTDPAGSLFVSIDNRNGGVIHSNATLTFNLAGNLTTQGPAEFDILNNQNSSSNGMPGGSIGLAATLDISAANISIGTDFTARILNHRGAGAPGPNGGSIGTDATLSINAASLTAGGMLDISIFNRDAGAGSGTGGSIGGNAAINLNIAGTLSSGGPGDFQILNESVVAGSPGGTIGGIAAINISAANIGDSTNHGDEVFNISNSGGTIGGSAALSVNAANVTANSLLAQIDNTGGSIGANTEGGATINMNVSGTATVTNNATVAIYGSDGAGSAAININGGSYNVGGTFLTYIDGNGTITFNNATAHADVLKAGVFGTNGVLNIGGGMLSADTELKLYASGSNGGVLNFLSNVTLGGSALTKILAANTINIFDNVVVTIGGSTPVDVYTNNANYTGFGGNGTRTGTFAGAGANNPQPLGNAPPFNPIAAPAHPRMTRTNSGTINVSNTAELLALLDGAAVGPDGKITVSGSTTKSNLRDLSRNNMNALPKGERRMLMQQVRDRDVARVGDRRTL